MSTLHAFFKPLSKSPSTPPSSTSTTRKRPRSLDSVGESSTSQRQSDITPHKAPSVSMRSVHDVTPKKKRTNPVSTAKRSEVNPAETPSNGSAKRSIVAVDDGLDVTPKKRCLNAARIPLTPSTPHTLSQPSLTPSTPHTPHTSKTLAQSEISVFSHEGIEWLQEDKVRDGKGLLKSHPDYNPKTLQVLRGFLDKQTPAQRQWWVMKKTYFDTILMFKVGKFYELYHMDAVVGVRECGLVFMKGAMAHCGFPELGFRKYSQILVQKGYQVARVEQTENPAMMDERLKASTQKVTKFDKVVHREVCSVVTRGTQVPLYQDYDRHDAASLYLMAIKEEGSVYGVCFIDTSLGTFHLGQFPDDQSGSRLRTLIAHYPPAHVMTERGQRSQRTASILKQSLAGTFKEQLAHSTEFWTAEATLKALTVSLGSQQWPLVLDAMLAKDCPGKKVAQSDYTLALSALGACVWELQRAYIDTELLSLRRFQLYVSPDLCPTADSAFSPGQRMVLDDLALTNLDVVDTHGQPAGTLLHRIDHTVTAFGKRRLREWACAPLCNPDAISARQEGVANLISHTHLMKETRVILSKLPDLERKIRKFHMLGCPGDHPDRRALFYDHIIYSKAKIADFIAVLEGFQRATTIISLFHPELDSLCSPLLRQLVTPCEAGGDFPCLGQILSYFDGSFDKQHALKAGVIVPSPGVNRDYDKALADIKSVEEQLADYLTEQSKYLNIKSLSYVKSGRNRYQIEVSESKVYRVPSSYEVKGQRKGYQRFSTAESEGLVIRLVGCEEARNAALKDNMTSLFHTFDKHFEQWCSGVECLSTLDALMSLADYSSSNAMCRPEVVVSSDRPFLHMTQGRHPCVLTTYTGSEFIPNDVVIDRAPCVVVTGPNMGGKSTLMRQTALIVILAQMGSFVPAVSCRFSPVDRVFTRIGASDRITAGESTFFVELKETAAILRHATRHSLVLCDELGRGTSTYDGTAIAWAVLEGLSRELACRCFFSTHYHSLVEELGSATNVTLGHMSCLVEPDKTASGGERVTFLYKFVGGACPHSYGFNVATMAGVPEDVVRLAREKASDFERAANDLLAFRTMFAA